jgi:hypothetical protein
MYTFDYRPYISTKLVSYGFIERGTWSWTMEGVELSAAGMVFRLAGLTRPRRLSFADALQALRELRPAGRSRPGADRRGFSSGPPNRFLGSWNCATVTA